MIISIFNNRIEVTMKIMTYLAFPLSFILIAGSMEAVLPPLWQSRDEIKSLLESSEIGRYLDSSEAIKEIKRSEWGYYLITNKHTLEARIRYQPQSMPGPTNFSWTFSIKFPEDNTAASKPS